MCTSIQSTYRSNVSSQLQIRMAHVYVRLTIQPCISGSLTIGDTPRAAIAGTASCIAPSNQAPFIISNNENYFPGANGSWEYSPSMLPCSQSTSTQSHPDRARMRDTFAPGIICHMPMLCLPWAKAVLSRLDACMVFILRSCGVIRVCVTVADILGRAVRGPRRALETAMFIEGCGREEEEGNGAEKGERRQWEATFFK